MYKIESSTNNKAWLLISGNNGFKEMLSQRERMSCTEQLDGTGMCSNKAGEEKGGFTPNVKVLRVVVPNR